MSQNGQHVRGRDKNGSSWETSLAQIFFYSKNFYAILWKKKKYVNIANSHQKIVPEFEKPKRRIEPFN